MKKDVLPKIFTIPLFILAFCPIAFSTDSLQHGQNIVDGKKLTSSKGTFELGFFSRGLSTNRFVGIWFRVAPDVVVWVANRDSPLNNTSGALTVDNNGSFALYDASEKIIWQPTAIKNGYNTTILQLQDSGNLILKDLSSDTIIWQSFDYPINTLLPGMKLGKNLITGFETYLSSWKSGDDPSTGNYSYKMDTEGAPEIIIWDRDQLRYRSGMWNGLYFSGQPSMVTYTDMFTFLFVRDQSEVSYSFEAKPNAPFSRLVLNESGVKQRLVWNQPHQTWNVFLSAPKDVCDYYATCGPFSVCQPEDMTTCSCLRGFEPAASTEWYMRNTSGGCQRRTPLGCSADSDGFYIIKEVKLPYSHKAAVDANISVEDCKRRCLMNCSCLAYAPFNIKEWNGCVMWNTELIDIKYVKDGQDLYVKISKSELGSSNKKMLVITVVLISTALTVILICFVGYLLWRKKRDSTQETTERSLANDSFKDADLPVFDIETILQATNNFSKTNEIGQGGFGTVYKGKLPYGQEIAVKRLTGNSFQGSNEFMNEVTVVAKLQHRNLVGLLGCCIHNNERMLIYEFLTNKSLDLFIFDSEKRATLGWRTRLDIIKGIARGLLYLHHDSRFNIIHRDLKAANILLDEEMNPKISDFGTARLFERDQLVIRTEIVVGTRGYMSPEYITEGKFSVKSDVYSFGVILLEIISGKRNNGNQNLVKYAWKLWEEQSILKLIDEVLESTGLTTELSRCLHVGLLCVQKCPDNRPSMSSVFMMLSSDNMVLPVPKKSLIWRSIGEFTADHQFYGSESIGVDPLTVIEGR
ncbi:G-type lectin S-receptor-like Serine/Threonine-kinase [Rhynchospora pubera]|uniref:Receptor-like serine/threonine-protein kinase n=1 Tax=Rhynchospora pubera TaxID=906938 RepID=A0AAV8G4D4_9POAL|nr:G-type lectin S-receptor-like Serine/Threonine-kinase [Rhynchospora pubera]